MKPLNKVFVGTEDVVSLAVHVTQAQNAIESFVLSRMWIRVILQDYGVTKEIQDSIIGSLLQPANDPDFVICSEKQPDLRDYVLSLITEPVRSE